MYQRVGKKLRIFAEIWCLLGVLGSVAAAVVLYTEKTPLWLCLLICAGGILLSVVSSWLCYAVGDIHVKLERLEDKLIPKPNYMSYLEESVSLRGPCEMCGKTTDLISAKIVDGLGTRYRKVCRECYAANECETAE